MIQSHLIGHYVFKYSDSCRPGRHKAPGKNHIFEKGQATPICGATHQTAEEGPVFVSGGEPSVVDQVSCMNCAGMLSAGRINPLEIDYTRRFFPFTGVADLEDARCMITKYNTSVCVFFDFTSHSDALAVVSFLYDMGIKFATDQGYYNFKGLPSGLVKDQQFFVTIQAGRGSPYLTYSKTGTFLDKEKTLIHGNVLSFQEMTELVKVIKSEQEIKYVGFHQVTHYEHCIAIGDVRVSDDELEGITRDRAKYGKGRI